MPSVSHRGVRARGVVVYASAYGAVGDGVTDNRLAIQAAIDAASAAGGGDVVLGLGTFMVSRNPVSFYCLMLKSNVRVVGTTQDGTVLKQVAGITNSTRLFYATDAVNCGLSTLTLDGNKANQAVNEHRHGLFAWRTENSVFERVTAQNFSGDGLYVFTGSKYLTFKRVLCRNNGRNGFTFGGECRKIALLKSTFRDSTAQQVDSEPSGVVDGAVIRDCYIDTGDSDGIGLTIGGVDSGVMGNNWDVVNNVINGSIWIVWAQNVRVRQNQITLSNGDHPAVDIYRRSHNIEFTDNKIALARTTDPVGQYVVRITATTEFNQPNGVTFRGNEISLAHATAAGATAGFSVHGATNLTIESNTIVGAGRSSVSDGGILIRATVGGDRIRVRNNTIRNWGEVGVKVYGEEPIQAVDVSRNTFEDTQAVPTMLTGVRLDNGEDTVVAATCVDNIFGAGITTPIAWPTDIGVLTSYTSAGHPVFTVPRSPEGLLAAAPGARARVLTGGVYGAEYVKRSSLGSSGWELL